MIKTSSPEGGILDVRKLHSWKFTPEIVLNPNRSLWELSSKDVRNSLSKTSFFDPTILYTNSKGGNYPMAHMATSHKVEVIHFVARPRSRKVCEEFIAKELWTTSKKLQSRVTMFDQPKILY